MHTIVNYSIQLHTHYSQTCQPQPGGGADAEGKSKKGKNKGKGPGKGGFSRRKVSAVYLIMAASVCIT